MGDGVDADVFGMEQSSRDHPADRGLADPFGQQLSARNPASL
jgi:hypothetical protein